MKQLVSLFSAASLLSMSISGVALAEKAKIDESGIQLEINANPMPIYPYGAKQEGIFEGSVTVALEIDSHGELRDYIIEKATDERFAQSLENVIENWRFSAPRVNGESRALVGKFEVQYEFSGGVVDLNVTNFSALKPVYMRHINDERYIASPRDLDGDPQVISAMSPIVSTSQLDEYAGSSCTFTFYVDEEGNVRMPAVSASDELTPVALMLASQEALEQWKFEPPTVNGKPVKVRMAQRFEFIPESFASN